MSESADGDAPRATEPSKRTALMDAALDRLGQRGVLAGLNLSEVAGDVGITPANIYHQFGSRQGLLRAALGRAAEELEVPLAELGASGFVERRTAMFDAIVANEALRYTALLALDGDPDYRPMPFLEETRQRYRELVEAGDVSDDVDIEAAHLVGLAAALGVSIYAESAARQLGVEVEEVLGRTRAVYEAMMRAAVRDDGADIDDRPS